MAGSNFCYPENHHFLENRSFAALNYDYNSILASIFTLLIYAILTLLYMRISFEKTQSNELVYFTMFIIGIAALLFVPGCGITIIPAIAAPATIIASFALDKMDSKWANWFYIAIVALVVIHLIF